MTKVTVEAETTQIEEEEIAVCDECGCEIADEDESVSLWRGVDTVDRRHRARTYDECKSVSVSANARPSEQLISDLRAAADLDGSPLDKRFVQQMERTGLQTSTRAHVVPEDGVYHFHPACVEKFDWDEEHEYGPGETPPEAAEDVGVEQRAERAKRQVRRKKWELVADLSLPEVTESFLAGAAFVIVAVMFLGWSSPAILAWGAVAAASHAVIIQ